MGPLKSVHLIVLLALSTANAFNTLLPWDKEVIYHWKALVKAGTHYPAVHASQFVLNGKVHLQANNNATHVKLTDLTFTMYNGVLDHIHEHEAHEITLPKEAHDLYKPFKIVYDVHGQVMGISTEAAELEYTRNMKRAIATILQMNNDVMKQSQSPFAFVSEEHSIYGMGSVDYNVIPHDEVIEVLKLHDMHHSGHLYQSFITNTEALHCDIGYEEALMHDSQKRYMIVKQDGHHIVQHIEADGGLFYEPFQAQSDAHYILVNQTFHLDKVMAIQQPIHMQAEHFENHLTYHHFEEDVEFGTVVDTTNGRHKINYQKLMPRVHEIIEEIHKYLNDDHLHHNVPDVKHGQAINRLHDLLVYFNAQKLEEIYKELNQKSSGYHPEILKIFHHNLPMIGTKAAAVFIMHLIVDKVVSGDVAVELLQHIPQHMYMPSRQLLTAMEPLIHLDDSFHWDIRRAAILCFASLVHKTHDFENRMVHLKHHQVETDYSQAHVDNRVNQEYFEKYVVEYVDKIRSSHDFKVQMVYMHGLYNMKMHSTIQHMMPALHGDWWHDHHLRVLAMWCITPAVLADPNPNTIIETLWPIFTNRDEHTELRIMAYYFIMQSEPTISRLNNIYWHMLTEPNDEVYNYHFTFINTMMHSTEPCRQQFRLRLAQVMKFMPPPSHGISGVHLVDYQDVKYGFSGGFQGHMIQTNESQVFGFVSTSQLFHVHHEDLLFYVKLHGLGYQISDLAQMIMDFTSKKSTPDPVSKDVHIEVVVMRHQMIVSSHYFNEKNMHELSWFLDFFVKESHTLKKNLMHMSFHRFHKALIPTDLGVPAIWEYSMPVVHKSDISIVKEVVNKVVNVHVDNKHVSWIHYRHGLSFYNPIVDVWHGIHRFHSFDSVLPLHWDINLNTQQHSLQLSWSKSKDVHQDVAGIRSHVQQMVFVKGDEQTSVLTQSSPQCKEWIVVSNGNQFRKDYTLIHDDDLNTGHLWHVEVFDSGHHISNGSMQHLWHLFTQTHNKNIQSPMSHLLNSFCNWHHYTVLLPRQGIYGVLMRVEPSHEHTVSNIELSFRLNGETVKDNHVYTPGTKWSTRMTYAVKNKEQSLKTWDINGILDMNPGHTVNNIKMHLTRIIPGQKDYKICVDGVKKWTNKGVTGHVNVAMSQTPDGKCVKDDTVIDVTMTGGRSHEQDHEHHRYGACHYTIPYSMPGYHTLHCLAAHTSVRHYVYNVKTTNVPREFKKTFAHWWDQLKGQYMSYYSYDDEHTETIGEHNLKVDVLYPMQGKEVDVHVTTPQHVFKLTGVPTHYWQWWGMVPDSTVYPMWFMRLHSTGWIDHCVVHHNHHYFNDHYVHQGVPHDWTLYSGEVMDNPQKAVYVKHMADDKIAVKVVDHGHTMEIMPHSDKHQISIDGHVVHEDQYYEDWVAFHVFTHEATHAVAVMLPHIGVHIEYDGHHVIMLLPRTHHDYHGHCYEA